VIVLYAYINRWGRSFLLFSRSPNLRNRSGQEKLPWKFGTIEDLFFEIEFSLLVEEKQRNKETKNIEKIRGRNVY
jgi:uncharacterized protein YrzB (UPF0473 family)